MSGESTWEISGRAGEPRVRGGGRRGGGGGARHRGGKDSTSFFFWKSFGRLVWKIRRLGSNFLGQRSVVDWWMSWVKMKGKVIFLRPLSHGLVKSPRVTESQYESKSLIRVIFTQPFIALDWFIWVAITDQYLWKRFLFHLTSAYSNRRYRHYPT